MEEQSRIRKFFAGAFFITGIGLIAMSVFVIGLDKGLTQPKFQATALFNEVGGLVEGAPIHISGVSVGVVGRIDFLDEPIEDRSLKVTLNIFKKYEMQFRRCSRISIKTEGVLGQKIIEISEDHNRKMFDVTRSIIGEDPLDVEDMAAVIVRTAIGLQKTVSDVDEVVAQWKYISHKTRRLLNRVEDKLVEGDLFKVF